MQVINGYSPNDYLLGRCKLPPSVAAKRQKSYAYAGDVTVNNNTSARLDIALDADSFFLVEGIEMLSSLQTNAEDTLTVQVSDTTYSQTWSNVAVNLRDLAGKGAYTHPLKFPNMLVPSGTLSLSITNSSGSNAQVYAVVHGRKFYDLTDAEMNFLKRRMWYQYVMQVTSLAAQTPGTIINMQIFNESDFLLKYLVSWGAWKYIVGATAGTIGSVTSPEIKCNFRDTSADRNFFSQNACLRLVVGAYTNIWQASATAFVPGAGWEGQFEFFKPMFIRRNAMIQGTFDNFSNGSTGAFLVVFEGARIFDAPR